MNNLNPATEVSWALQQIGYVLVKLNGSLKYIGYGYVPSERLEQESRYLVEGEVILTTIREWRDVTEEA